MKRNLMFFFGYVVLKSLESLLASRIWITCSYDFASKMHPQRIIWRDYSYWILKVWKTSMYRWWWFRHDNVYILFIMWIGKNHTDRLYMLGDGYGGLIIDDRTRLNDFVNDIWRHYWSKNVMSRAVPVASLRIPCNWHFILPHKVIALLLNF